MNQRVVSQSEYHNHPDQMVVTRRQRELKLVTVTKRCHQIVCCCCNQSFEVNGLSNNIRLHCTARCNREARGHSLTENAENFS